MVLEEIRADKSFILGSENPGEISDQLERLREEDRPPPYPLWKDEGEKKNC